MEMEQPTSQVGIYHDRFGFLTCHLRESNPIVIITQRSQEKAIMANLEANGLEPLTLSNPLTNLEKEIDFVLLKIPKSLELFRLFLEQIVQHSSKDIEVHAAFMTRHFTPKIIEIAKEYFEEAEQGRAVKKARVLILRKKKEVEKQELINAINYKDQIYKQYWGVFSAAHIDYATQYFLDHLRLEETDQRVLDLASGNGIIGLEIAKQLPEAEIHLMDDSYLAVASAKLNGQGENIHHHFNDNLSIFEEETFDLIVTNPPFHFEYEINIQVPIQLFKDCFRCLRKGGNLQLVANRHLNYKVHLEPLFSLVEVVAENEKFVLYGCLK